MILDHDLVAAALPGYEIGKEIGRGGCGVVLEGSHRHLERAVAIKQLPRAFGNDAALRERFLIEARLLASLDHPHIVPVYDFVEHEGLCVLVMEKLTGGTVWRRFQTEGFTIENACAIVLATCAALHYAHERGVLHRDVKPENLLLSSRRIVKVSDFGIATVLGGASTMMTAAGEVLGTPAYMAPEQAQCRTLSPATDVYAAGIMLYELLSGRLPYPDDDSPMAVLFRHVNEDPEPLGRAAPHIPEGMAEAVMGAIARAPENRYQSAEAFGNAVFCAACSAWGPDWLSGCEFPVLAAGNMLSAESPVRDAAPGDVAADTVSARRAVVRASIVTHSRGASLVGAESVDLVPAVEGVQALQPSVSARVSTPATAPDGSKRRPAPPPEAGRRRRQRRIAGVTALTAVLVVVLIAVIVLGRSDDGVPRVSPPTTSPSTPAGEALAGPFAWRSASDAAIARQQVAVAVDGGTIWVMGGLAGNSSTTKVEGYDPAIDTWKSGPELPVPLHHAMATTYRGQVVVLGGWVPSGNNLTAIASDRVFALRGGTWVELPHLNRPRAGGAAAVAGGKLVVVGGQADGKLVPTTEVFDGTAWTDAADIPTPRDHLAAASDGQMVYAVGGRARSADRNLGSLERFDPVTGGWQQLPDMPTARGSLGATIAGRTLVAVGGENPVEVFKEVEAFDLDGTTWRSLPPMPTPRHGLGLVSIGTSIFAIDGSPRPTHAEGSSVCEVLDVA